MGVFMRESLAFAALAGFSVSILFWLDVLVRMV